MHRLNAMLPSIFIHQNDFGTSKALISSGTQTLVPHRTEPSQKLLLATFVCYNRVSAGEMDCMDCWYLAGLGFCIRWYRRTWYIKKNFRTSEMLMHRRMQITVSQQIKFSEIVLSATSVRVECAIASEMGCI